MTKSNDDLHPKTLLVGAGVVGCAILRAHLDANVPVGLADQDPEKLEEAVGKMDLSGERWYLQRVHFLAGQVPGVAFWPRDGDASDGDALDGETGEADGPLVIESISEKLEIKQAFFAEAERALGHRALLCTNTSTLRIGTIAQSLSHPERFCGMHFFMPVYNRPAVEVACGSQTSAETIQRCSTHVRRLRKEPLVVRDGPGFIVNRLLSPYLNEAMLLLCRGVSSQRIERAALRYGMPMSPLELIDWIGTRTMFDAGRVFWQSFPNRIRPAAMLGALVKSGRFGRARGGGFYDYTVSGDKAEDQRSPALAPEVTEFVQRYRRDECPLTDDDVMHLLSIPMWIEAAIARREGVVQSHAELDLAMRGGLGFAPERSWLGFFDSLGSATLLDAMARWSELTPAIAAPTELQSALRQATPSKALQVYAAKAPENG